MMLDYINARIEDPTKHAKLKEVHEMQRVWLLQCIFRETARNLFTDGPQWFAPVQRLCMTYSRYAFLFKKLGADLPKISINVGYNDTEQDKTAERVWGSFNQHNEIIRKMKAHVGNIGKNFLIKTISDVTIDDDKLCHTSKTFSDHGLQRTGFRGSRCGPVMNGAGSVQSGLILSIYFSCKGDAALSVVKALLRTLGYGEESNLKQRLDILVLLDRGYNIASVIRLLLKLRCQLLGTHSENAGKWPYCTGGNPKEWQAIVPIEGARAVLFSKRKINNVECHAMCYRNGNKGVGMLHSTLSHSGVWDLFNKGPPIEQTAISFNTTTAEMLYLQWLSSVLIFVACQGSTPWFEARVGHLTGTTALKLLKTIKFILFDHPNLPASIHALLKMLGLSLQRKSNEQIGTLTPSALKKAYKALGFKATSSTTCPIMIEALVKQYPSDSLVFQKLVTAWCMAPIKSKSKGIVESFRQGLMAEPLIHENVVAFIKTHSREMITVVQAFNIGLVKCRDDHVSAVSPDAICVLECSTVPLATDDESQLASDVKKLSEFLSTSCEDNNLVEELQRGADGIVHNFMSTMEYKHKSEAPTIQEARRIVSQVLNGRRVHVLNLCVQEDIERFHSAVPNINYRCQVIHEAVTCKTSIAIYAVATTQVEFVLILIVPVLISSAYRCFTNMIRTKYLGWLFKEGTNEFDDTLCGMPKFTATEIAWGYAKDAETVRCRLGVMISLYQL